MLLALLAPAPSPAVDAPVVFAHRGGAGLAPENTIGAFRATSSAYPDVWLELDTQLTADAELVVIHDATLDRTTDCTGAVIEAVLAALAPCDARGAWEAWPAFEPIPTMREVLAEGAEEGWRLMVELKNIPTEPNFDPTGLNAATELVALIDETDFPVGDILVQSFFPTSLDAVKLADASIRVALLTTATLPGAPSGVGFPALSNVAYSIARGYEVSAPDHRSLDLAEAPLASDAVGHPIVVWTPNSAEDIARAVALGVEGIISDRPDRVLAQSQL